MVDQRSVLKGKEPLNNSEVVRKTKIAFLDFRELRIHG